MLYLKSYVRLLCVFSVFFMVDVSLSAGSSKSQIVNQKGRHEVILGISAKRALKAYDQNFKLLSINDFRYDVVDLFTGKARLPMAAMADFNGDGAKDLVLMGSSGGNIVVVMLLVNKTKKTYRIREIERWAKPIQKAKVKPEVKYGSYIVYLSLLENKKLNFSKSFKNTKLDAVQIETYMSPQIKAYYLAEDETTKVYTGLIK